MSDETPGQTCKRCNGRMLPGIALQSTLVEGVPDMRNDKRGVTLHAGGPGEVVRVLKCERCGYSVSVSSDAEGQITPART